MKSRSVGAALLASSMLLVACGGGTPDFPQPDRDYSDIGLSDAEAASLLSLEKISDFPLYSMTHYAEYGYEEYKGPEAGRTGDLWACTLFAALADSESKIFARNFDWRDSPTLVLFTDPPKGHAAVAVVDIEYLEFTEEELADLTVLPLEDLTVLLDAHHIPFDGLNEEGLAIAMALVPAGNVEHDPDKETIGSLGIIRAMLDKAATVEEAIDIFDDYNIDFEGGPPLHYLVADASGDAAVLEHYEGEIRIAGRGDDWEATTNFIESSVDSEQGKCWRQDIVNAELAETDGVLSVDQAFTLLEEVAQVNTQWSVVYQMLTGEVQIAMGREFETLFEFDLEMAGE